MTDDKLVEAVAQAIGNMTAFPNSHSLGVVFHYDGGGETRQTLNNFVGNTHIAREWPGLCRRAAQAAIAAVRQHMADDGK